MPYEPGVPCFEGERYRPTTRQVWNGRSKILQNEKAPDLDFDVGKALQHYYPAAVQATNQDLILEKLARATLSLDAFQKSE